MQGQNQFNLLGVTVDYRHHEFSTTFPTESELTGGHQHFFIVPKSQSRLSLAQSSQVPDPAAQVVSVSLALQLGQVKGGSQVPVIGLFQALKAKLTPIIN